MAQVNQPQSLNNFFLGFALGFLVPLIFFFLYFLFRVPGVHFSDYFKILTESGKFIHVISLSVFSNLLPFFLFLNSSRFRTGRGILGATVLMAIVVFVLKFLN